MNRLRAKKINLKRLKESLFVGLYAKQIHFSSKNNVMTFTTIYPLLKFQNTHTKETWYWQLTWHEDEEGDDHLFIEEHLTPVGIDYTMEPDIDQAHLIIASGFSIDQNTIQNIYGYGYKDEQHEVLSSIVFEFETHALSIQTGPVMSCTYAEKPLEINRPLRKLGFL